MAGLYYKNLGDILVKKKFISRAQLVAALETQRQTGERLGKILLENDLIDEDELYSVLEDQLKITIARTIQEKPDHQVFQLISPERCREMLIAPIRSNDNSIRIYFSDPSNLEQTGQIQFQTGKEVDVLYATEKAILDFLKKYSPSLKTDITVTKSDDGKKSTADRKSPAVRYTDNLIQTAIRRKASDIHLEIYPGYATARYRIDGILTRAEDPDPNIYQEIIARIKYLANLDLSQKRLPQDGNIPFDYDGRSVDMRVSVIPSIHGENAVLRILDQDKTLLSLEKAGFNEKEIKIIHQEIRRPQGMILFTGPTGSGKTTSLYSILRTLKPEGRKIITIEDPVEYQIDDILQVQVLPEIGLTFASGLRSFLRHDPDIILVGEIRDHDTAEIAIRAAMTGRLVFSTLHTNSSTGAVQRLIEMGVPPYLISSTVKLIGAQRLVRKLCNHCRQIKHITNKEISANHLKGFIREGADIFSAKGCKACEGTGYSGRTAIFELFRMNAALQDAVNRNATEQELTKIAENSGFDTLFKSGIEKVKAGITTLDEVLRINFLENNQI